MGEAFLDYKKGGSGGLDINGIIEDYYVYAGENVNAGDFVEFVNGIAGSTSETSVDTAIGEKASDGSNVAVVELSENKVFIAHNSSQSGDSGIYGVVCTISGATITKGTDTKICTGGHYEGIMFSIIKLDSDRIFIAHRYDNIANGIVCRISGSTISVGTDTQLSTTGYAMYGISTVLLPDGKVFVSHSGEKGYYLYGIICTISGTTITKGTDTKLSTTTSTIEVASASLLPNGNVFIAHNHGTGTSYYFLYGIVTTINGTTITAGTDTQLSTVAYTAKNLSTSVLENGNVFIAHSYNSSNSYLYGIVCTFSGTTISKGSSVLLNSIQYASFSISTAPLPNNGVLITHSSGADYYLYGMICKVSGTTITKGTDTQLNSQKYSGQAVSTVLLNDNAFVAHSYPYSSSSSSSWVILRAQLFGIDEVNNVLTNQVKLTEYETQVRPATSLPCDGVASTSGEGGDETGHKDVVSVYRMPYSVYNLVKNGDFSNGIEGWYYNDVNSEGALELSASDNILTVNLVKSNSNNQVIMSETNINTIASHVYYARLEAKSTSSDDFTFKMTLAGSPNISTNELTKDGEWHILSLRGVTGEHSYPLMISCYQPDKDNTVECKNVAVYDLTAMFGSGNEPTQEWCDANL